MRLRLVEVRALAPERLETLIGPERATRFEATAAVARDLLGNRLVLNVNSTATGGGVAEMLQTLLAYARGVGVDARWAVIEGDPGFFEITKRLHHGLYGSAGDGGPLGPAERDEYEAVLHRNAPELSALVRPGDVVLLHDPQTAGLAGDLTRAGASVVWRCHVGVDEPDEHTKRAWEFLRRYLEGLGAYVFSRAQFAPEWVPEDRLHVIPPSIDPFSAKNAPMASSDVRSALQYVGLLDGGSAQPVVRFVKRDGSAGRIDRHADILQTGPPPPPDAPLVLQASRWDAQKDMVGVMHGFARHLPDHGDVHLVLAGPSVLGVADDPEAARVLDDCMEAWWRLPEWSRRRIHLACVPMADVDEAATIVNALQRHARVVVQKSLAEGFGLTVAEAMWKARPVVGSAVGGIADQIVPGETGVLLDDPRDLEGFAASLDGLLTDTERAEEMGAGGRQRAIEMFLGDRHLEQWAQLFARLELR